jgi:predicted ATP-dependent serine protease
MTLKGKADQSPIVPSPLVERTNNAYNSISLNNRREAPQKGQHRNHSDTQHFDHFYKSKFTLLNINSVILAGDAGVGKSNFLLRYVKGVYDSVPSTIGVEFAYKVHYLQNQTKVKAQIWDTCKKLKF